MKTKIQINRGFTLVEIMIVVLIIGILLGIATPNFLKARESGRQKTCISNLRQIEAAKDQWAMDTKKDAGTATAFTDLVGATLYLKSNPTCPANGTYTVNAVGTNATCSKTGHAQ